MQDLRDLETYTELSALEHLIEGRINGSNLTKIFNTKILQEKLEHWKTGGSNEEALLL